MLRTSGFFWSDSPAMKATNHTPTSGVVSVQEDFCFSKTNKSEHGSVVEEIILVQLASVGYEGRVHLPKQTHGVSSVSDLPVYLVKVALLAKPINQLRVRLFSLKKNTHWG